MIKEKILKKTWELTSDFTLLGLPNIFKRKRLLNKIFWTVYVFLSTTASIYLVIAAVNDYFEYDIITKIESNYQQPLQFPAITFCSANREFINKSLKNDILLECTTNFFDNDCRNNSNKYFEVILEGTCFRFNSGKNVKNITTKFIESKIGGRDDSIRIKIKTNFGLRLYIHNAKLPPKFEHMLVIFTLKS
jgi:hypothetical protein